MITFWVVSALLMAGALLFVIPPLLGGRVRKTGTAVHQIANLGVLRDQLRELETERGTGELTEEQYVKAKGELERRVLDESQGDTPLEGGSRPNIGIIAAIVVLLPAMAIPMYLHLGSPEALNPAALAARTAAEEGAHSLTPEQVEQMVARLAARLKEKPDDVEGWVMLARSYNALGHYDKAAEAFRTLTKLLPADAQLLADYADTLAMAQGKQLQGEPEALIARALQIDAGNIKALALAGTAAFERQDYAQAIEYWQRIAASAEPDSPTAKSVEASIAEARNRLGGGSPPPTERTAAAMPASVTGRVEAAPGAIEGFGPDTTVFVFARAAQGPRMPLAVLRKQLKDLPIEFKLDDSMAMSPAMRLSGFPQVVVGARVSRSGSPMAQPGDVEALSTPVPSSGATVRLVLGGKSEARASPRPAAPAAPAQASASARVSGQVSLGPGVDARVSPSDTVFIFARAASGPRMPLAILRKQVKDLPLEFALDDTMAMAPNFRLSAFPEVVIGARVSKSGNAAPQPGDFEAISEPVKPDASGVKLVIGQEIR